ncbi:MAG: hypothetical protein ACRDAG_04235 [Cetobacterium somerae]|uniref:hypothetical protein n=1 Tax=Cetobacterium TaxID=180162 RepID=UPI00163C7A33|nr:MULTISPECIES: hypothetical protein [Cetobacterium]MBC2854622.1 hypothetical protein [Cetobacterium sp. 2G large]MCQ9628334.1 hypothetical protein [Cetobacterium somerae]WVJ02390.1 hypothetical protein VSU16_12780 [Cetobacterium somerae]
MSILVNILIVLYLLKTSETGYNILELINGIIFTFSFGFGVPVVISGVLAVLILLTPGIVVYFLWNYLKKITK